MSELEKISDDKRLKRDHGDTEPQEILEPCPKKRRRARGAFDLLGLPDDELSHLLQFLRLQDKKNLRKACRGLAERVMYLSPEMRHWRIYLGLKYYYNPENDSEKYLVTKDFLPLKKAKAKGITDLSNVKIHFDTRHIEQARDLRKAIRFMAPWDNKIVGMVIRCFSKDLLSLLNLPNLEKLKLMIRSRDIPASTALVSKHSANLKELDINYMSQDMLALALPHLEKLSLNLIKIHGNQFALDMLRKHSQKLKELKLNSSIEMTSLADYGPPAPKLKHVAFCRVAFRCLQPTLEFCRHVTKLELWDCEIIGDQVKSESLGLVNLRELVIVEGFVGCGLLIKSNAAWLETLQLFEFSHVPMDGAFVSLPQLKTLVLSCIKGEDMKRQILEAAAPSLQTLICTERFHSDGVKLPKLKKLLAQASPWSWDIIKLNSETLESITLGVHDFDEDLELPSNLPATGKFSKIIVCEVSKSETMTTVEKAEVQAKYPNVEIQFKSLLREHIIDHLEGKGLDTKYFYG
eukprot:TRINITY_DN12440_c0_g1_i1.p1 TRINITY_DN12440_c0_g1~~TRINITY_DN12440_c0_g1_i1.p1  ORF type:complete len:534 (+),score=70.43 TRINITY_DN12440_c0_g1_i1:46-1602(+)